MKKFIFLYRREQRHYFEVTAATEAEALKIAQEELDTFRPDSKEYWDESDDPGELELDSTEPPSPDFQREESPLWIETNEIPDRMRFVSSTLKMHHQRYYKGRWQLILKDSAEEYTLYDGHWPDVPCLTLKQAMAIADEKVGEHG